MTEKEVERHLKDVNGTDSSIPRSVLNAAIAIAKQHGAKFDQEPAQESAKLPFLRASDWEFSGFRTESGRTQFSAAEIAEIIWRCNTWEEVRILAKRREPLTLHSSPLARDLAHRLDRILGIMEGKS